jgi:hypothetical protein
MTLHRILCLFVQTACFLRFQPAISNTAETELKCNTGFREHINLAFYHIQTVGA